MVDVRVLNNAVEQLEHNSLTELQLPFSLLGIQAACMLSRALNRNSSITRVGLRDNDFCGEGANMICESLLVCPALTSVDLAQNGITSEHAAAIAKLVAEHRKLKVLDLGDNSLGIECETSKRRGDIDEGSKIGIVLLADALKSSKTSVLKHLDLSQNKCLVEGAAALAAAIRNNKVMETLGFGGNACGMEGWKALAAGVVSVPGTVAKLHFSNAWHPCW